MKAPALDFTVRLREVFPLLLLVTGTVLYAVGLAGLSNQPPGSHPDEYGKALQIIHNERNYNHPQFLLVNLELASFVSASDNPARLVKVGRKISNIYAAIAVLALSLVGWRLFGPVGGVVFFVAFSLNPALLVGGRYLKEDIFLVFAIALLALSFTAPERREANVIAALGCAVALSSKYIGAVFVVTFALAHLRARHWQVHDLVRVIAPLALLFTCLINYKILLNPLDFVDGLNGEVSHVTTTHDGISLSALATMYPMLLAASIPLSVLAITPFLAVAASASRVRPPSGLLLFLCLSAVLYALLIQVAPVKIPRYGFPLLVLISLIYLIATGVLLRGCRGWLTGAALIAPATIYAATLLSNATVIIDNIQHDTRQALFSAVTHDVRFTNATLLADAYSGLGLRLGLGEEGSPNPNGVRIRAIPFSADECRPGHCDGVDYVVIACTAFQRFFRTATALDGDNMKRKDGYAALLSSAAVVESIRGRYDDNEGRFGMYESPCVHIVDARRLDGTSSASSGRAHDREAPHHAFD